MEKKHDYGLIILRLGLGILFIYTGIAKLFFSTPSGVSQFLGGLGFPLPILFAWILILAELLGGIALVIGFKAKWASALLGIVIIVAILTVQIKALAGQNAIQFFKDLTILTSLIAVYILGPGCCSFDKKHTK